MPRAWTASTSALNSALVPKCGSTCGEVGDPVAVIAGAFLPRRALHGLVLEDRRDPYRGRAETLDIVEALDQALEVAAVVEALARRIEAGAQPVAGQAAAVVRRIAVLEPVGQQEIDDLVLRQPRAIVVTAPPLRQARERAQRIMRAPVRCFTGANLRDELRHGRPSARLPERAPARARRGTP